MPCHGPCHARRRASPMDLTERSGRDSPSQRRPAELAGHGPARVAMTSTVCRAIAAYRRTWDWSSPKQSLPNAKPYRWTYDGTPLNAA